MSLNSFAPVEGQRPQNVGIHAIEVYFPTRCISEADLEKFDNVPSGKYTIGLGAEFMAFCDDREDVQSFSLNAVSSLLKKYNVDPKSIGRIDVGTETIIDKSKAVKTVLMDLFAPFGNTDIEGIDSKSACYGGTAALFNAINWVESSSWDGRNALVVASDIAIYAEGSARPTGGAGAVALLIGPNAPLVLEPVHGTYMNNIWDFYKPALDSEYPEVDGPLSVISYPQALDGAYEAYRTNAAKRNARLANGHSQAITLDHFDFFSFHSPYGKQVIKAWARLAYNDFLTNPTASQFSSVEASVAEIPRQKTLTDKNLEKTFISLTKDSFKKKVSPSTQTSRRLGNMYSASVYGALASLIDSETSDNLLHKRIGVYSYGSGATASLFSIKVEGDVSQIKENLKLKERLAAMDVRPCEEYVTALKMREHTHNIKDYVPSGDVKAIRPGTYYLTKVDGKYRRFYEIA